MANKKIKLMIVDDAAYFRFILTKFFGEDSDIEIIATAKNGLEAIEKLKTITPDVITMDIEMPKMNGIELLKYVMSTNPIPTIMLSSLTPESTDVTIRSLQYGAIDFINKDAVKLSTDTKKISKTLLEKVKIAATAKVKKINLEDVKKVGIVTAKTKPTSFKITKAQVVAIGCSTGGPKALNQLIPLLPNNLPVGILIVQHMPEHFTKSLANRLNESSRIVVKEAEDGDLVLPGRVLIAPGGFHMEITKNYTVRLTKAKPVNHVRPSVDVLYDSLIDVYKENITAVVLTGMGQDGADGALKIKNAGGKVLVEDQSTCTIYGMPKAVVDRGAANKTIPLDKMANEIIKIFK